MPISLRLRTFVIGNAAQVVVQQFRPCGTGTTRARSAEGGEQCRKTLRLRTRKIEQGLIRSDGQALDVRRKTLLRQRRQRGPRGG